MSDDELERLKKQARDDRKLIQRAERALAEIDRGSGLTGEQADVLAALRIRIEGKERAKLEDLIATAGEISTKKDLGAALAGADQPATTEWPEVEEKKRDWPGL